MRIITVAKEDIWVLLGISALILDFPQKTVILTLQETEMMVLALELSALMDLTLHFTKQLTIIILAINYQSNKV